MARLSEAVLRLAADLRRAGARTGPGEVAEALQALERVGVADRGQVFAALRCTLARDPDAWEAFPELFERHFRPRPPSGSVPPPPREDPDEEPVPTELVLAPPDASASAGQGDERGLYHPDAVMQGQPSAAQSPGSYSPYPGYRRGAWDPAAGPHHPAYAEIARRVARRLDGRPSRRYVAAAHGPRPDLRRLLRGALALGGEPLRLRFRRRKRRPDRVVVLCDVSGSMSLFGRVLMRFAHALQQVLPREVEVFVFSTSLLRVTPYLRQAEVDRALRQAAEVAADWGGGTRIADCVDQWCRRYASWLGGPHTVILLLSDGVDMGDRRRLEAALRRLRRHCRRLLWLNPLLGDARYWPLVRKQLVSPLPGVDAMLPAHSPEALGELERHLR